MRRGMNPEWLVVDGKVIGITLGADFVSEHEWGIGDLKMNLGVDGAKRSFSQEKPVYTKPYGIARRSVTKSDAVKLYEHAGSAALICEGPHWHQRFQEYAAANGMEKAFKDYLPQDLRWYGGTGLRTAWDGGSFGVLGQGADAVKIKELFAEFEKKNVAIWVGGRILFENGGLVLAIVGRIPADKLETLRKGDEDAELLQKASDATGIIGRLNEAKRGFFACSPRWFDGKFKPGGREPKTAHPVIYFLNPQDQGENNCGWYTVEELDQWIAGTGPIPMKKEKIVRR